MKLFFNLFGLAAAAYLGYMVEPSLRFQLTGNQPSAVEKARDKKVILDMPGDAPQIELSSLTPDQLPPKVLLKTDVKVTDATSGMNMLMQAGNRVKLVRIEGGNAVVSPGEGPFSGLVPVTETDLFQQLAANPPVAKTTPEAPPVATMPEPVAPATGDSEEPAKMAEPPPVPEPAPEPAPEATPEPAPTPIPEASPAPGTPAAPAGAAAGSEEVVKAMQESIKAAQIKEFTFDQVLEWKADANEIVDGETYQTGLASYKAETIFGMKTIQAKALIKGTKVQRWIWPKSGMEIK